MEFKQLAEGFTMRLCDASDTSPHHDEYPPTGREPRGCPMPGACACPLEANEDTAEAPAVIREAPLGAEELWKLTYGHAAAEVERLRAELSALRSSLSGVIAEMEKSAQFDDSLGQTYAAMAVGHWVATLKRLQGEP